MISARIEKQKIKTKLKNIREIKKEKIKIEKTKLKNIREIKKEKINTEKIKVKRQK